MINGSDVADKRSFQTEQVIYIQEIYTRML